MDTVFDAAFLPYGRVVTDIQLKELLEVLAAFPLPKSGMIYSPREDDLHAVLDFAPFGARLYADMPYQLGYCAGSNSAADTLARHGGSAFICSLGDFEIRAAHRWESAADMRRFRVPANTLVEIYGDTLRSAPLGRDFRILVILPFATNTEWRQGEETLRRNTWLVK